MQRCHWWRGHSEIPNRKFHVESTWDSVHRGRFPKGKGNGRGNTSIHFVALLHHECFTKACHWLQGYGLLAFCSLSSRTRFHLLHTLRPSLFVFSTGRSRAFPARISTLKLACLLRLGDRPPSLFSTPIHFALELVSGFWFLSSSFHCSGILSESLRAASLPINLEASDT